MAAMVSASLADEVFKAYQADLASGVPRQEALVIWLGYTADEIRLFSEWLDA